MGLFRETQFTTLSAPRALCLSRHYNEAVVPEVPAETPDPVSTQIMLRSPVLGGIMYPDLSPPLCADAVVAAIEEDAVCWDPELPYGLLTKKILIKKGTQSQPFPWVIQEGPGVSDDDGCNINGRVNLKRVPERCGGKRTHWQCATNDHEADHATNGGGAGKHTPSALHLDTCTYFFIITLYRRTNNYVLLQMVALIRIVSKCLFFVFKFS